MMKRAAMSLQILFMLTASAYVHAEGTPEYSGTWAGCANVPWVVQEVYGTTRDGKIFIAGGMIVADNGAPRAIDRTGVYDPLVNRWQEGPRLPEPRHHPLLVSTGGVIYAFGGATHGGNGGHWQAKQDVYTLKRDGGWTKLTDMPVPQTEAVVAEYEGRIHVIGGRTPRQAGASAWAEYRDVNWHYIYDIAKNSWSEGAPLPAPRNSAAVGVIDGFIYVAGGRTMDGGNIDNLDRYDPVTNRWESLQPMPYAGGGLNGAVAGGQFYVFGGEMLGVKGAEGVLGYSVRYNPADNTWQSLPDMPTPRHGQAVVAINRMLFTIGGGEHTATGLTSDTLEAFRPDKQVSGMACVQK